MSNPFDAARRARQSPRGPDAGTTGTTPRAGEPSNSTALGQVRPGFAAHFRQTAGEAFRASAAALVGRRNRPNLGQEPAQQQQSSVGSAVLRRGEQSNSNETELRSQAATSSPVVATRTSPHAPLRVAETSKWQDDRKVLSAIVAKLVKLIAISERTRDLHAQHAPNDPRLQRDAGAIQTLRTRKATWERIINHFNHHVPGMERLEKNVSEMKHIRERLQKDDGKRPDLGTLLEPSPEADLFERVQHLDSSAILADIPEMSYVGFMEAYHLNLELVDGDMDNGSDLIELLKAAPACRAGLDRYSETLGEILAYLLRQLWAATNPDAAPAAPPKPPQ